jgi:protein-tyrosine phosphatase
MKIGVLFVCTGNICRSPMAHAVFQHLVAEAGLADQFEIESAGTSRYHVGESTHRGTIRILAQHHISFAHTARHVLREDVSHYAYLIAMASDHEAALVSLARHQHPAPEIKCLLDYVPDAPIRNVPDPYYADTFAEVYDLVRAGCEGLLAHIRAQHQI